MLFSKTDRFSVRNVILFSLFSLTFLSACTRVDVTKTTYTPATAPYRTMMVCSMALTPDQAAYVEKTFAKTTRKKFEVDILPCSESLHQADTSEAIAAAIRQSGADSVLVLQRQLLNTQIGESPVPRNQFEFSNLDSFVKAYKQYSASFGNSTPSSKNIDATTPGEKQIAGRAVLLSLRNDQIVWNSSGWVIGVKDPSSSEFVRVIVDHIDADLREQTLINKR